MSLIFTAMAQDVHNAMGFSGIPSNNLVGWCKAIVKHLQVDAKTINPADTITGIAPPSGGPLVNGAGTDGLIINLDKDILLNYVLEETGSPNTIKILNFCDAIITYFMAEGRIIFSSGTIVGTCTNTLLNPGTFTGSGSGGKVQQLIGSDLAGIVQIKVGYPNVSTQLLNMCMAICDYINNNSEIIYVSCSGTVPAGGGPILGGFAISGVIL